MNDTTNIDILTGTPNLETLNSYPATASIGYDPLIGNVAVPKSFEQSVFELTNEERLKAGLAPLTYNPQLEYSAENHSTNMALQDFFSHTGIDGSTMAQRIGAAGYQFSNAAENIAAGYTTPEQVVGGWMNSPGHRANILNPNLTEIGVGYYCLETDPGILNYNHYWTQNFGSPL